MPTILVILGWRLFFYANEGNNGMNFSGGASHEKTP
jgi:hypothetical protein